MGFWDVVYYTGDLVIGHTPDISTVKRAGSAAVTKIDEVVGIKKLYDHYDQKRAQIIHFTTTLAKNVARYALYEGYRHIPGAPIVVKLISETMREVEQTNHNDGIKSTSQPESSTQNSESSSQNAVKDRNEKTKKTKVPHSRM